MKDFQKIPAEEICQNTFTLIGKEWMLVTAQKPDGTINTMTASWGGMGVLWNKNVAFVVIRPQRYTKEFVDAADSFSLTFFGSEYKKQLMYLGTVSGRDEDKIANAGLTTAAYDGVPYLEEAKMVLICRKLFVQDMTDAAFVAKSVPKEVYPTGDFHTLYIAEIESVWVK